MSKRSPSLILASTSVYRHELLSRLGMGFVAVPPEVDETPLPGEAPQATAARLAQAKAAAVSALHPHAVVIGSDQVADLDGQAIGKPGTHEKAVAQLRAMSARLVVFHTAICVVRGSPAFQRSAIAAVAVRFRTLGDKEIETYLQRERPYDCAGSARSEGLGIALVESITSDDPTALVGLPLIRTSALLREAGLDPLGT